MIQDFLQRNNLKGSFSKKSDGPCNLVGHEIFDGERRANMASFLKNHLDIKMEDAVFPQIEHRGNVEVVSKHNPIWEAVKSDAIITDKKKLALTIPFADCPSVILYDRVNEVLALMHCGWKPLAAGIIRNTVERMRIEFNCYSENIVAYIGPGICKYEYEIGELVIRKLLGKEPFPGQKALCDLPYEIARLLQIEGVRLTHITYSGECTYHEEGGERYFSWRRDRSNPLNGQIAAVMMSGS